LPKGDLLFIFPLMIIKEGQWTIQLLEDLDGHLSVWLTHDDKTPPVSLDSDIAIGDEWGERFSTLEIERKHKNAS